MQLLKSQSTFTTRKRNYFTTHLQPVLWYINTCWRSWFHVSSCLPIWYMWSRQFLFQHDNVSNACTHAWYLFRVPVPHGISSPSVCFENHRLLSSGGIEGALPRGFGHFESQRTPHAEYHRPRGAVSDVERDCQTQF